MNDAPPPAEKLIDRQAPDVEPARAALVKRWLKDVAGAKKHWDKDFKRMRRNMRFAAGEQWPNQREDDDRFMVNLVQRAIKTSVASLYAKNPTVIAKRRPKLDFLIWDGRPESIATAQQVVMVAQQALVEAAGAIEPGMEPIQPDPALIEQARQAEALLADVKQGVDRRNMIDKIGKTLVRCTHHYLDEGEPTFKLRMKQMIRRVRTTGVGYVRLEFQREMDLSPDQSSRIADMAQRLATIGRLAADVQDGEVDPYSAEAAELEAASAAIRAEPERIIREGLLFGFPHSTRLIPSPSTEKLMGWVGTEWLAEEIMLAPDRVKEVYGVDIGSSYTAYRVANGSPEAGAMRKTSDRGECSLACIYHVFDKLTGMQFVLCEGYPDFLRAPASPDLFIEQFFPYFAVTFNDGEDESGLFPKSDVELLTHIQREYNRAKEAKRQHRIANRPLYLNPKGTFEEDEVDSLSGYPAHAVISVNALEKGRPASDLLAPMQKIGIDPNLYETTELFEDMQRVTGNAEANLGGTGNSSATESNIAENSRQGSIGLDSDDLDEMLSALFRACGTVLLTELSAETAKKIAGIGAVWPELSREEIANELWLEVKGGSSGRPNQARDAATFERVYPLLVQVPGVSPRWLAEKAIRLADDDADLEDAIIEGIPSIIAQNAMAQPATGDPSTDPTQQGGRGNDPQGQRETGNRSQPGFPGPGAGGAGN